MEIALALSRANLYSIDLFKDELIAVRNTLNLEQIHLFGQSWGGCLPLEHALSQATGLVSLILANTPANIQQFVNEDSNNGTQNRAATF